MIFTNFTTHMFMPGHTIEGVIKKENMHAVTEEELKALLREFNRINGELVPRVGQPVKIPILLKYRQARDL